MKTETKSLKKDCLSIIKPEKTIANIPSEIEPLWEYITNCMDTFSNLISDDFITPKEERFYQRALQQIADDLCIVMTPESRDKVIEWMSAKVSRWYTMALEEEAYETASNLKKLLDANIITYNGKSNAPGQI